ncbi:MAG: hypothetical protein IKA03_05245, partial [Alphaproteobacteria bacterium]|nr:hypothetical protein [Alphaproteobacteria bacterium]
MISINTNLSSLIAQSSMKKATSSLNQAVERMTTGFKINHAKDNAAGYGISTQMQTKLYAYDVAADNVAMGMDLVNSASDMISMMQDHATRLRDLATQARNGTYGGKSLEAINAEVGAILSELDRLYNTAEYNKVSLFNHKAYELSPEHQALAETVSAKEEYGGFIADPKTYEDSYVDGLTSVTSAINGAGLQANEEYKVATKEDLQALATFVNGGGNTENMTFILAGDIDLSSVSNWTPIGNNSTLSARFKGTFDGNGHKIKNLTINNPSADNQGLFGHVESSSTIQNVGIEGANVEGKNYVGGLAGRASGTITNSYATGDVSGQGNYVGGLAGIVAIGSIINSYATGDVTGQGNYVGGLAGSAVGTITNSYATGDVSGNDRVGGLLGLVQYDESIITNTYATGDVNGNNYVGGLVGYAYEGDDGHFEIHNSYASGNIQGKLGVGGIIGYIETFVDPFDNFTIDNCTSYSKSISGDEAVGSIVGQYVGE